MGAASSRTVASGASPEIGLGVTLLRRRPGRDDDHGRPPPSVSAAGISSQKASAAYGHADLGAADRPGRGPARPSGVATVAGTSGHRHRIALALRRSGSTRPCPLRPAGVLAASRGPHRVTGSAPSMIVASAGTAAAARPTSVSRTAASSTLRSSPPSQPGSVSASSPALRQRLPLHLGRDAALAPDAASTSAAEVAMTCWASLSSKSNQRVSSLGRPSTRSATRLSRIWVVPPAMLRHRVSRNPATASAASPSVAALCSTCKVSAVSATACR